MIWCNDGDRVELQDHPGLSKCDRQPFGSNQWLERHTQEPATGHNHSGHPGAATLHNVGHSLRELKKIIQEDDIKSIAIPRLATGVGGLKWEDVKPLIYSALEDSKATVYIYSTFVKGQAAEE